MGWILVLIPIVLWVYLVHIALQAGATTLALILGVVGISLTAYRLKRIFGF